MYLRAAHLQNAEHAMALFERSKYTPILAKLCDGSRTASEVADIIGCNSETVNCYVRSTADASVKRGVRVDKVVGRTWTDENIELLKKLWDEGVSCSQIAARIPGASRNAVIGKVHRLGLPRRATKYHTDAYRSQRAPSSKPKQPRKPAGNPAFRKLLNDNPEPIDPVEELVIPEAERKTLQQLEESHCRWPIGDPQHADFHFCGRQKVAGLSYCNHHAKRAYVAPQPRQRSRQKPYVMDNSKEFETV